MGRTYIIAEAGVNHNGSLEMAKQLIDVAADAGADAVKFQTFKSEHVISKFAPKAEYQTRTTGKQESQLDMVKKLELDAVAHMKLLEHCKERGIHFLSTPFDISSVDLLVQTLHVDRIKLPSGEITNGPLLLKTAMSGKPIILSTGMASLGEIEEALGVLAYGYLGTSDTPSRAAFRECYFSEEGQQVIREKVTLLHCTTEYPAPYEEVNLQAMETMRQTFGVQVGLSDHTEGIAVPIAAAARGAFIIEKHFTLDRNLPGPDHKASLEPQELKWMVQSIRQVEMAIGSPIKMPSKSEYKNRAIARKSLIAAKGIYRNEFYTPENLTTKRPGTGVSPMLYWDYVGNRADRDYQEDEVIGIDENKP